MALAVKRAQEFTNLYPWHKFSSVRYIQVSVGVKNILVHHDISSELTTGDTVTESRITSQVSRRAVHNLGKTVQLLGGRNLVAAIYKIRLFRGNRPHGMRRHGQHGDGNKRD